MFTVSCMKPVIFLLCNNLFIYKVFCTLIYRRLFLIIWKEGDHYDGITPSQKHWSDFNGPVIIGEKHSLEDLMNPNQRHCSNFNRPLNTGEKDNLEGRIKPNLKHCPYIRGSLVTGKNHNLEGCINIKHVKILSMNICGLYQWKLADDGLGAQLKKYDIVLLQETWSAEGDVFYLDGYTYHIFPKNIVTNCPCGETCFIWMVIHIITFPKNIVTNCPCVILVGLGVFIKHTVADGVTFVKYTEEILAWLKLERSFFSLATGLYVGYVYVVMLYLRLLCICVMMCLIYFAMTLAAPPPYFGMQRL